MGANVRMSARRIIRLNNPGVLIRPVLAGMTGVLRVSTKIVNVNLIARILSKRCSGVVNVEKRMETKTYAKE